MKKVIFFLMIFSVGVFFPNSVYMWEYVRGGDRSCCLSLSGHDICNPNTPCTRNIYTDLMGINDYITRLLGLEKSGSLSYVTILNQAQYYIRHVLYSSTIHLSYRYDEQRNVKFFHEITESPKSNDKTKPASTGVTQPAGVSVSKNDEVVWQYLVKLGLARPLKK